MNKKKSDIITAIGTACILGFILFATFTGLRPDELNKKVSDAQEKFEKYKDEFSENYSDAKKEVEEKYGNAVRVSEDSSEEEETVDTTSEEEVGKKKVEDEQFYIEGEKFEVVIGESCDRLHEACGNLRTIIDKSNGDYKKVDIKQAKKEAEIIIDEYNFIINQNYPAQHESQLNAFRNYGYGIDETVRDFINNYKDVEKIQYDFTSDSLQTLYNATNNIFIGYRLK